MIYWDILYLLYCIYTAQLKSSEAAWGLALQGFKGQFVHFTYFLTLSTLSYYKFTYAKIKTPRSRMNTTLSGI